MSQNGKMEFSGRSRQRTIKVTVRDKPGVLARVVIMFRRRGFNIISLSVGPAEKSGISRMTIVVDGVPSVVNLVAAQLGKLVDVVEVQDVTDKNLVWRELALIKVRALPDSRHEIIELCNIFRASILDIAAKSITFEITGGRSKIDSLIELLRRNEILEVMRTGRIAALRGAISEDGEDGEFIPTVGHLEQFTRLQTGSGSV